MDEQVNVLNTIENDTKTLGKKFNLITLFIYALPSIFTVVFIALYQTVDGFFIASFCDELAVTATEIYYPVITLFISAGVMLGTGANSLMIKALAEHDKKKANSIFTSTCIFGFIISVVLTVVLLIFADPIMRAFGASDVTIVYCRSYYYTLTACGLFILFQIFGGIILIGIGKSVTSGVLIVIGGVLNCILDFVFMNFLKMGILGAAIATVIGYAIPVVYIFYYSFFSKKSIYNFNIKTTSTKYIKDTCICGLGEFITNFAIGITSLVLNRVSYRLCGDEGVAAISVLLYIQFIGVAMFSGLTLAIQPIFSYHYGKKETKENQRIFKLSLLLISIISILTIAFLIIFNKPLISLFFTDDIANLKDPFTLTINGSKFFIPTMIFVGFNMFAEILFTSYVDGKTAAILSISRTLILFIISIYIMSYFLKEGGLWASWFFAEAISFIICTIMIIVKNKKYHYIR